MRLVSSLIARGYQPSEPPPASGQCRAWLSADAGAASDLQTLVAGLGRQGGVLVSLPTYLDRTNVDDHAAIAGHVAEQTRAVDAAEAAHEPIVLLIGMQHAAGREREAETRLHRMLDATRAADRSLIAVGLRLAATGKLHTVNATIELAEALGVHTLVLLDDDIRMEPRCLSALLARHRRDGRGGAVGAVKEAESSSHWSGRLLKAVGAALEPARSYPHACCMTVDVGVVAGGIPWRYVDDGYIFFELVEPAHHDPLHRLVLEPAARCHHVVGGHSSGSTLARQRRMLIMHHIFLADYPAAASYYRRRMLFYGLWPVGDFAAEDTVGAAVARWLLKLVYASMFFVVGVELALRGLIGRPLTDTGWGTADIDRPREPAPAPGTALAVNHKETSS